MDDEVQHQARSLIKPLPKRQSEPEAMPIEEELPINTEKKSSTSAIALGAMIAFAVGAAWVLHYLVTTSYGIGGFGDSLLTYVTGQNYGSAFDSTSVLTVILARLVLAFGFAWPTATFIIALFRAVYVNLVRSS